MKYYFILNLKINNYVDRTTNDYTEFINGYTECINGYMECINNYNYMETNEIIVKLKIKP